MRRREFLTGSAALGLSAGAAHAFGIGQLGAEFGRGGALGVVKPPWWPAGSSFALDFKNGRYNGGSLNSLMSVSRASNATDLLPSSPSGYAYNTYGSNVLAVSPSVGLLDFEARTNLFLNPTAPVTQTITVATGSNTLWVNGSGSATIAAGTATITGAGTAVNGAPVVINCTVAGTVVVTISGSLNASTLEAGAFGTPFLTHAADVISPIGALLTAMKAPVGTLVVQIGKTPAAGNFPFLLANAAHSTVFARLLSNTMFRSTMATVNLDVTLGSGSFATGTVKMGWAWDGTGRSVVGNNGTPQTDANTLGGISDIVFGPLDGPIEMLTLFPTRLSVPALSALTV